jgi:hypothetical protein
MFILLVAVTVEILNLLEVLWYNPPFPYVNAWDEKKLVTKCLIINFGIQKWNYNFYF